MLQRTTEADMNEPDTNGEPTAIAKETDETIVLPDTTETEVAELAWSQAADGRPDDSHPGRHPLPRALTLLLVGVCAGALGLAVYVIGYMHQPKHNHSLNPFPARCRTRWHVSPGLRLDKTGRQQRAGSGAQHR